MKLGELARDEAEEATNKLHRIFKMYRSNTVVSQEKKYVASGNPRPLKLVPVRIFIISSQELL